jgi:cystathionine gamma-synthase
MSCSERQCAGIRRTRTSSRHTATTTGRSRVPSTPSWRCGLRTLAVRLDRAEASAAVLARRLVSHPHVSRVNYPGLPGDPQHERASRVLLNGAGSMLSFEVAGSPEQTEAFLARLRLLAHATSLGGVESLIERRARYAGDASIVGPTLCRLSVGIENVEDLWADLDSALRAVLG